MTYSLLPILPVVDDVLFNFAQPNLEDISLLQTANNLAIA